MKTKGMKLDSLDGLMSKLQLEESPPSRDVVMMDCLAYRLVSCCHLHTLHRTIWNLEVSSSNLETWRSMERVGDDREDGDGAKHKSVRWRSDVSVMKAAMIKDLDTISAVVTQRQEVKVAVQSILPALLFKMSSSTNY